VSRVVHLDKVFAVFVLDAERWFTINRSDIPIKMRLNYAIHDLIAQFF
jgi:hypothetical protein